MPGAIGSDTGGRYRIPAALCGLTGINPLHGASMTRAYCRCRLRWIRSA
ncbi:amidase [Serratia ureilytica]